MRPLAAFGLAVLTGIALSVAFFGYERWRTALQAHELTQEVWVTDQMSADRIAEVSRQGFKAIIDLRPDGEEAGQPTSESIGTIAMLRGLQFAYVPVQHGDIPNASVDALAQALRAAPKPVLLYCRTGRRAARTWALVEAKRPGGLDAASIERAVQSAGQTAEDLDKPISQGVADRESGKH